MAFKKFEAQTYPRRLWGLYGFPGCGKSTFAAQMRGPILSIDADHRWDEVAALVQAGSYQLSDTPSDNVLAECIADRLQANMPGSDVRTIVVDSLTAIMARLVTRGLMDNDAGRNKNLMDGWREKAFAMRLLQDSIGMWGTDVLYVYHLQEGRGGDAKAVVTATVSRTELARLTRSLNLQLRVLNERGRRGVHVDWARRGRGDITLWDDSGTWKGMPEKIEQAVYGGLSKEDQDRIEGATPKAFVGPEQAIAWGTDQGCFEALQHARNAYDEVKRMHAPKSAQEMWDLWVAEVTARKAAQAAGNAGEAGDQGSLF